MTYFTFVYSVQIFGNHKSLVCSCLRHLFIVINQLFETKIQISFVKIFWLCLLKILSLFDKLGHVNNLRGIPVCFVNLLDLGNSLLNGQNLLTTSLRRSPLMNNLRMKFTQTTIPMIMMTDSLGLLGNCALIL